MKRLRTLAAWSISLFAISGSTGLATDPERHCAPRDRLVPLLTGKPHNEKQALVLKDQMPSQGHLFELFLNRGEGGRHSFTLIRTRRGAKITCIVSAGLVDRPYTDERDRAHLVLKDEGHPEALDIITCEGLYVITKKFEEKKICKYLMELYGADSVVVSYGRIVIDRREYVRQKDQ